MKYRSGNWKIRKVRAELKTEERNFQEKRRAAERFTEAQTVKKARLEAFCVENPEYAKKNKNSRVKMSSTT